MSLSCTNTHVLDISDLGPDDREVVRRFVERVRMGAGTYGPLRLATDKRRFLREAGSELYDALYYIECEGMRDDGHGGEE